MTNDSKAVEWAVVQELLPFGYRIEKICGSREEAEREARTSPYLTARPLEWVRAENERLSQPAEFTRELHEWSQGASGPPPAGHRGVEW